MIFPLDHKLSKRPERVSWSEIVTYLLGYLLSTQNWGARGGGKKTHKVDLMADLSSTRGEANDFQREE